MAVPAPPPPIGEDDLHGWVDGRLTPARAALLQQWLEANPDMAARLRADATQRSLLRAALAPSAAAPIPARLRLRHIRAQRRQRRSAFVRVAAAVMLLLGLGTGFGWMLRGPVAPELAPELAPEFAMVPALEASPPLAALTSPPITALARDTALGPWLADHLGEEMPLPALENFGFHLDSAWVLQVAGKRSALLRYVDPDGIALSLWRAVDTHALVQPLRCADGPGGVVTYAWSDGRHHHALSAALPRDRLRPIALAVETFTREAPRQPLLAALPRRPCLTGIG